MKQLQWLAKYMPEILHDQEYEIMNHGHLQRRRLKALMMTIKSLYPDKDVELVRLRNDIGYP